MKTSAFLDELKEIFQTEGPLQTDMLLESIEEWDSMAGLGVMSLFEMEFDIILNADQLGEVKKIQDIVNLAGSQIIG